MKTSGRLKEMRQKEDAELELDLQNLRKELFDLRFQSTTEKLANPARISQIRRDVARIRTILNERRRGAGAAEAGGAES